jgi:translation initiation factor 1
MTPTASKNSIGDLPLSLEWRKGPSFVATSTKFSTTDKGSRLVYSTDPELNKKCLKCKELVSECTCRVDEPIIKGARFVAVLRIEKSGRAGKTVTVIDQLPKNELFLKGLTTMLKKKCGAGGTYRLDGKEGLIEIQGDKRELARAALEKEGIRCKG